MKLRTVMEKNGISQRKLSLLTNITSQDLNQAINGKKPFFPSWRKRVSEALKIPENELFPDYINEKEVK